MHFFMLPLYDFLTLLVAEIARPVLEDGGPPTTTEARQPGRISLTKCWSFVKFTVAPNSHWDSNFRLGQCSQTDQKTLP